jgi:uroporphyrinogen III methyltransferase/synthase
MRPPAIIVVGEGVRLRERLAWFEKRPLFGRRIVVTRAREQASGFMERLSQLGAECIQFPTIEVRPPESFEPMDSAIEQLSQYDWLLFTSVNGVKYFLQRLHTLGGDVRDLKGVKIGAIGPGTAGAWMEMGIRPDLVPEEYRAEAIVEGLGGIGIKGKKILIPRAVKAREILPLELRKMGAEVEVVPAYQTVRPDDDVEFVKGMLDRKEVHMVTFTSSSTVTNFVEMFGSWKETLREKIASVASACIGPITAKTAEGYGFSVDLMPSEYTIDALTEEIVAFFSKT